MKDGFVAELMGPPQTYRGVKAASGTRQVDEIVLIPDGTRKRAAAAS